MIPRAEIEVCAAIPERAAFWVPGPDDIDAEEGFGNFRDVWTILGVKAHEAAAVIQDEQVALRYVDAYARDADAFELLAEYVEHSTLDDADDDESIASVGAAPFVPTGGSEWTGLEGLELGVAGLVYALSTRGFFPAASCRSHAYEHSWSDRPVVLFAADRGRVEWLRPLVERAGCGFCVPRDRGQLLTIEAPSIVEMGALAQLILAANY